MLMPRPKSCSWFLMNAAVSLLATGTSLMLWKKGAPVPAGSGMVNDFPLVQMPKAIHISNLILEKQLFQ